MRVLLIFDSQSKCRTARALLQMGDWFSESPYPRIARCTVRWERATHSHRRTFLRHLSAHALTLRGAFWAVSSTLGCVVAFFCCFLQSTHSGVQKYFRTILDYSPLFQQFDGPFHQYSLYSERMNIYN
jgi:hypothetical protein